MELFFSDNKAHLLVRPYYLKQLNHTMCEFADILNLYFPEDLQVVSCQQIYKYNDEVIITKYIDMWLFSTCENKLIEQEEYNKARDIIFAQWNNLWECINERLERQ